MLRWAQSSALQWIVPAEGRFSDTGTVSPIVKMLVMQMTPKWHQKSNFGAHFRLSDGPDKIFWVHSIPCHLKKVCHATYGWGYASPPLAQTAKVNVDFSEIDHLGSGGSTGDRCLQDTGEGGFGRCAPRANLVLLGGGAVRTELDEVVGKCFISWLRMIKLVSFGFLPSFLVPWEASKPVESTESASCLQNAKTRIPSLKVSFLCHSFVFNADGDWLKRFKIPLNPVPMDSSWLLFKSMDAIKAMETSFLRENRFQNSGARNSHRFVFNADKKLVKRFKIPLRLVSNDSSWLLFKSMEAFQLFQTVHFPKSVQPAPWSDLLDLARESSVSIGFQSGMIVLGSKTTVHIRIT